MKTTLNIEDPLHPRQIAIKRLINERARLYWKIQKWFEQGDWLKYIEVQRDLDSMLNVQRKESRRKKWLG